MYTRHRFKCVGINHYDYGRFDSAKIRRANRKFCAFFCMIFPRLGAKKQFSAPSAMGAIAGQLAKRYAATKSGRALWVKVRPRVCHSASRTHAETAHTARHFHFWHGNYNPGGARNPWAVCMSDTVPIILVDALLVVISVFLVVFVKWRWRLPCAIPARARHDSEK